MADQEEEVQVEKPRVVDAKGPEVSSASHSFCPMCNKVLYSVWRYGPMVPAEQNRFFCTCLGEASGEVKKKFVIYDVDDVKHRE